MCVGACGPLGRAFTHGIRFFDVGEVVRVSAGHRVKLGLQPLDLLTLCAPKLSLTVMPAHAAKVCTSKRDRVGQRAGMDRPYSRAPQRAP